MMTTNIFFIADVKQLRTKAVLEFYCLLSERLGVFGILNSAILKLIRMLE
jgi:hypothetical protein